MVVPEKLGNTKHFNMRLYSSAVLFITEKCNFKCSYCFEHDKTCNSMTLEEVKDIVDRFLLIPNVKNERLDIWYFGGEPLIEEQLLIDAINYIGEFSKTNSITVNSRLFTNGYLYSTKVIEAILNHKHVPFTIQVSYDGVGNFARDFNDSNIRNTILKNIEKYSKTGIDISIRSTFSPKNYVSNTQMFDIMKLCLDLGLNGYSAHFIPECGDFSKQQIDDAILDYTKQGELLLEVYKKYGVKHFFNDEFYNALSTTQKASNCGAGYSLAAFRPGIKEPFPCQMVATNHNKNVEKRVSEECLKCDVLFCLMCPYTEAVGNTLTKTRCLMKHRFLNEVYKPWFEKLVSLKVTFKPTENEKFLIDVINDVHNFMEAVALKVGVPVGHKKALDWHVYLTFDDFLKSTTKYIIDLIMETSLKLNILYEEIPNIKGMDGVWSNILYITSKNLESVYGITPLNSPVIIPYPKTMETLYEIMALVEDKFKVISERSEFNGIKHTNKH